MKRTAILFQSIALLLVILANRGSGQIQIYPGPEVNPDQMVQCILGDGILYENVTFQGASVSRGIFTNGQTTSLGFESGIFLTSGAGIIIPGPNNSSSIGVNNATPGDASLNSITTSTTYDASVLEFDMFPETDTLKFKYVFGGEEYNEWVGGSYNDVFGCFISGIDPSGGMYANKNIAIVPGTTNTSVKINSINNGYSPPGIIPTGPCTNCQYYIDNTGGLTLEYDGLTVALMGWIPVVPCEMYHIKMGVADAGDGIYDCGVFIEENSFTSSDEIEVTSVLDPPGMTDNMVEGHVEADLIFKLIGVGYEPVTICFEIIGTATNGMDYEEIDNCINFEIGEDSVTMHVTPIQDGLFEGDETIVLIIENNLGCEIQYDTVEMIIEDYHAPWDIISPSTVICEGCEATLWVDVVNGYPPYSYLWEPGGFTTDSVNVSPDTTTTYVVTYSDLFGVSGMDSTTVVVFPVTEFSSFGFEAALNPGLPFDVTGEFTDDTIQVHLPAGTNLQNLIASYTFDGECIEVTANGVPQEPGVTPNDFTNPVIYSIISPGGCGSEWMVIADIETGNKINPDEGFCIYPNPSNGKFFFEIPAQNNGPGEIMITDLSGRTVFEEAMATDKTEIDLSDHPKGMYFLEIKSGDLSIVRKLLIQ